jgi:hypothetical protein
MVNDTVGGANLYDSFNWRLYFLDVDGWSNCCLLIYNNIKVHLPNTGIMAPHSDRNGLRL